MKMKILQIMRRTPGLGMFPFGDLCCTESQAEAQIAANIALHANDARPFVRGDYHLKPRKLSGPVEYEVTMSDMVPVQINGQDHPAPLKVTVVVSDTGVALRFAGYGDHTTERGYGEPVFVENRQGVPHVLVWGDINREEPTAHLSLEGARESRRDDGT
jgi:hypothetical protein